MALKLRHLSPFMLAAAAAVSIAAAPVAMADNGQSCTTAGYSSTCESPGNVQINDAPPFVQAQPDYPFFLGGLDFHHGR
jgi:hypothetical protein